MSCHETIMREFETGDKGCFHTESAVDIAKHITETFFQNPSAFDRKSSAGVG